MGKTKGFFYQRFKWSIFIVMLLACVVLFGCSSNDDNTRTGTFVDAAVQGLNYSSQSYTGLTDEKGSFSYLPNETITFTLGGIPLGSATGSSMLTPLSITSGATAATDQRVTNICRLLQTLDADGALNNGIQINSATRAILANYAALINFNQAYSTAASADAFGSDANVKALLADLNAAGVFTDTYRSARTLRAPDKAQEHFTRSTAERKVVATQYGSISGYSVNTNYWQWLGVPYAKPPVGDLRWEPPQALASWSGVRDATGWGDQAPQPTSYTAFGEGGVSEDCLYLNITAPKNGTNLPVMVWFHGGAFGILTGNTKGYNNPLSLPSKGVVLVSVTHRLGAFGYLAHPLLTAESGYGGSGNYGQMDLIAALTWIKNNIAAFGGNPDNVTIFGQSGGGSKAVFLMAANPAKNLFHKVICQSGMPASSTTSLAAAEAKGTALFSRLGVTTLAEARALPWSTIVQADVDAFQSNAWLIYGPNIDNHYLTDTIENVIKGGLPVDVPFMAGANAADLVAGFNMAPGVAQQMPWRSSNNKAAQYVYKWSYVPPGWAALGVGAYHGIELVYVDAYPASFVSHYLMGLSIIASTGASLTAADIGATATPMSAAWTYQVLGSTGYFNVPFTGAPTDESLSVVDQTMTIWTNFARTGDPSMAGFTWPAYTTANDTYVEIGADAAALSVKTGLAAGFGTP